MALGSVTIALWCLLLGVVVAAAMSGQQTSTGTVLMLAILASVPSCAWALAAVMHAALPEVAARSYAAGLVDLADRRR